MLGFQIGFRGPQITLSLSPTGINYDFSAGVMPAGLSVARAGPALYTDATGTLVQAATDVARFDHDPDSLALRGLLLETFARNKCLNYNANPTDLTGMTTGGDPAAVLSIVDDSAALAAAGLGTVCSSGLVYRLDNSLGSTPATAKISGAAETAELHSFSAYIRGGTGNIQLSGATGISFFAASDSYRLCKAEAVTPDPMTDSLYIGASAGEVIYFVLNQFEETSATTSPIVVVGASAVREEDRLVFTALEGVYHLDFHFDDGRKVTLSDVDMTPGTEVVPPAGCVKKIVARSAVTVTGTDVFLLAGQSNMVGRADDNGTGAYPLRVQQYGQSDLTLKAAASPLDHFDEFAGDMGLARQFCIDRMAARPDRNIVLIPRADGGTGFSSGYWRPGGTGYETAVADANTLMAAHPDWNFAGILWHQGESDAGSSSYETDLDTLISGLRTDILAASEATCVVLGRINASSSAYDATIDAIIADTPNRFAYTAVVAVDDLTLLGDGLHFDGNSLDVLGTRYHAALDTAALNVPSVPAQVSGVTLTPDDAQITASWVEPADHGAAISDYVLEISEDGLLWTGVPDGVSTQTNAVISGLTNDTTYQLRIAAVNSVGQGPFSDPVSAVPSGLPSYVEADASAHWFLGTDNSGYADLLSGLALTEAGVSPTLSSGYLTINSYGNGLSPAVTETATMTACFVIRKQATTSAIVGGTLNGSNGNSLYVSSGSLRFNERNGLGNKTFDTGAPNGAWLFVACSLDANGNYTLFRGNQSASVVSTGTGTRNPSSLAYSVGDVHYASSLLGSDLDIAEAIFFMGTAKTQAELEAIYARSVSRLGDRGLTVS